MNLDKILPAAKAWAALIGAIVTALLGTVAPDTALFDVLTAVAAVATAITVYRVPNKRTRAGGGWVKVPTFDGPLAIPAEQADRLRRWYDSHGNPAGSIGWEPDLRDDD